MAGNRNLYCILFIQFLSIWQARAQVTDTFPDISSQPVYEEAYENLIENTNREDESENTIDLSLHKIDINTATYDDWAQLGLLTPAQILAILQHRQKHGDFLSIYELIAVNGITEPTLRQILPFLYVKTKPFTRLSRSKHELLSYWKNRFENDSSNQYLGSSFKFRNNYSFEAPQLSIRLLTEKDEGEPWFSGQITTFDYVSAAFEYRPNKFIRKITVGDYTCQFGQGLAVWNRWDISQNIYTANLCRINSGSTMHRSYEENNFFRGLSITAGANGWEFTAWGSSKYRDATINSVDSNGNVLSISNLLSSGTHATANQLKNRHSVREMVWGGDAHYTWKNLVWGLCGYQTTFSANILPSSLPYKSYSFAGNRIWVTSSYMRFHTRQAIFYAENAISNTLQNYAFIGGVCYMPLPDLTLNWLYRYYTPGYFSPYANAYALNTKTSNEKGYCMALNYHYNDIHTTIIQLDFANNLWLRYAERAPTNRYSLLLQQNYENESIKASFRYRYNRNIGNITEEGETVTTKQHHITMQVWQQIWESLRIHHRIDFNMIPTPAGSKGALIAQDIDWKFHRSLSLSARYAIFNTDDWDSRIYAYEKNIWRVYSSALYYGKGIRTALMLKVDISRQLRCWIRYSTTHYSSRNVTTDTSSTNSEVSVQMYWRW